MDIPRGTCKCSWHNAHSRRKARVGSDIHRLLSQALQHPAAVSRNPEGEADPSCFSSRFFNHSEGKRGDVTWCLWRWQK